MAISVAVQHQRQSRRPSTVFLQFGTIPKWAMPATRAERALYAIAQTVVAFLISIHCYAVGLHPERNKENRSCREDTSFLKVSPS